MNKFSFADKVRASSIVDKGDFIQEMCRGKVVLDMGCVCHDEAFSSRDDWLHARIKGVARELLGVDYLESEVKKLQEKGFNIIHGDVTQPINLSKKFDVVVAGDIVEHLVNFEGFFKNLTRLLAPGGMVILSTPNPFYAGEFHYVSFKRSYLINPEHTCWIDPMAMKQLISRFGFDIREIHFIKNSWLLGNLITENRNDIYDILKGEWTKKGAASKIWRRLMGILFNLVYLPYRIITFQNTKLVRYSDYLVVLKKVD